MNIARFTGGPLDGQSFVTPEGVWPLAADFTLALVSTEGEFGLGRYEKTNESQLDDEVANHPGIARGADYGWVGSGETLSRSQRETWNEATGEGVSLYGGRDK